MFKLNKKCGLTLTDLLLAIVILLIVMIGVAAVDQSIQRTKTTSARSAQVKVSLAGVMMHIVNNVSLAAGHRSDQGIQVDYPLSDPDWWVMRIRQDRNGTPGNLADDTVIEYILNDDGVLTVCMDCGTSDPSTCICPGGNQITLANNLLYEIPPNFYLFDFVHNDTGTDPGIYLEVNLKSFYNVNRPQHPITNPTADLTTRVYLPKHTWAFD